MHARLRYEKGTVLIEGNVVVPFAIFDPRRNCYRGDMALNFHNQSIIAGIQSSYFFPFASMNSVQFIYPFSVFRE